MTHKHLGISWVTLKTLRPAELIEVAGSLQCAAVALLGQAPAPGIGQPIETAEVATLQSMLAAREMTVSSLDILRITADFDPGAHEQLLQLGGALAAQRLGAVVLDPDSHRAANNIREFAARAREHRLSVGIEFVSFTPLRTLRDAVALIERVDDPGVMVTFDVLHFTRTDGRLSDLDEATVKHIGNVQICDGPRSMPADRLMWEATTQRMIPGEGSFDLTAIFARLPQHLMIDIEAPLQDLHDQGVPPLEQARRLVTATDHVLERARDSRLSG